MKIIDYLLTILHFKTLDEIEKGKEFDYSFRINCLIGILFGLYLSSIYFLFRLSYLKFFYSGQKLNYDTNDPKNLFLAVIIITPIFYIMIKYLRSRLKNLVENIEIIRPKNINQKAIFHVILAFTIMMFIIFTLSDWDFGIEKPF